MPAPRPLVGRRIGAGFALVIVGTFVVSGLGVVRVEQISERLTTINDSNSVKQRYAINFRGSVHDRAIALRDVVTATTPRDVTTEQALIDDLAAAYEESAGPLAAIFAEGAVTAQERAAYEEIQRVETATMPLIEQVQELKTSGRDAEALQLLTTQAKPQFIAWLASINVLIDLEESMNETESDAARAIARGFLVTMALLSLAAAVLGAVVAWRVSRGITRPLQEASAALTAVAGGDLTRRLDLSRDDEVGDLARSANTAVVAMGEVMSSLADNATRLGDTSERIAGFSRRIAAGAEESLQQTRQVAASAAEVSANVQTVAAGTSEMGTSIEEIAHSTSQAASVAGQAVRDVEATTETVSRLGESSRQIGDVVATITAIAEQTNLLALNATIEAARAGELGKGFAVVASEVKDLAQETARATEDISRRVAAIQADTAGAASAIAGISEVIGQINDHQATIASAVEEQSATTSGMNRSVSEAAAASSLIAGSIDAVADGARSTSATVAESEDAALSLGVISSELQSLVSRFRC